MLPTIQFSDIYSRIEGEISQKGNENAYTRLFILPEENLVAKVCYKDWDSWQKNLKNLMIISDTITADDFSELNLANSLLEYDNKTVGYLMPYLKGHTLYETMENQLKTPQQIVCYFEQLASIVNTLPTNISIGDLHSRNVMITDDNRLKIVDVDGFSVSNGYTMTCPLHYDCILSDNLPFSKYFHIDKTTNVGKDTDIYCLCQMFFCWLLDGLNPYCFSHKRLLSFFEYLSFINIPKPAIEMFKAITSPKSNYIVPSAFSSFKHIASNLSYNDFIDRMGLEKEELAIEDYISQITGGKNDSKILC